MPKKTLFFSIVFVVAFSFVLAFLFGHTPDVSSQYYFQNDVLVSASDAEVDSFIKAVIPQKVWGPNEQQKAALAREDQQLYIEKVFSEGNVDFEKERAKPSAPWLLPYMGRQGADLPKQAALYKWDHEITIGLGWPALEADCARYASQGECKRSQNGLKPKDPARVKFYPVMTRHIKELMPDIERLTGLPVRFISPEDEISFNAEQAKIRISLWTSPDGMGQRNFFKVNYVPFMKASAPSFLWHVSEAIPYFWGAVPFTPDTRSQVDGYILPNVDNTIGMAFCNVSAVVGEKLVKALITECLARALGVPSLLPLHDGALGHWNKAHDVHSMSVELDGPEARRENSVKLNADDRFKTIVRVPGFYARDLIDGQSLPDTFSLDDERLIAMLYCKAMKAGMDESAIRSVFSKKPSCKH